MTNEEAVKVIKSECYVANLLNLDRTRMINTALDKAVEALEGSRLKGEWRTCYSPGSTVRCSNCWKSFRTEWDFCPNCGADMRGDSE